MLPKNEGLPFYFKEKKKIVNKAYTKAKKIMAAARQHGITPSQTSLLKWTMLHATDWMLCTLSSIERGMQANNLQIMNQLGLDQ